MHWFPQRDQGLAFVARHAAQCAHLAEIHAGTLTVDWARCVTHVHVSVKELREVYAFRHRHLERFSSAHAERLQHDVAALLAALSTCTGDNARLWRFNGPGGLEVDAWDDPQTERLLGCVKVYDRRVLSDEQWRVLWGEKT